MTYLFMIARFLARCALIGALRCSSAKRLAARAFQVTSFKLAYYSDPGQLELEARASRVRQHNTGKLLRYVHVYAALTS